MAEVRGSISCKVRETAGKGNARKLRASGQVPVVAYGRGLDPRHLSLDPKTFRLQRQRFGRSYIYDVDVPGQKGFKALIKSVDVDPVTQEMQHVDLYVVDMTKPIRVEVPVELLGKPIGAIDGGLLQHVLRRVEVLCLPDQIPTKLTVDVSALAIGGVVHTSEIALPEGVTLTSRRDEAVAIVVAPEAEEEVKPAEGLVAGAEGATPAEGEAAAAGAAGEKSGEAKPEAKADEKAADAKADKKKK